MRTRLHGFSVVRSFGVLALALMTSGALAIVPATVSSASTAVYYAYAGGTGLTSCETTSADCSIAAALFEIGNNTTATVYLESTGSETPYLPTSTLYVAATGANVTIEPASSSQTAYFDGSDLGSAGSMFFLSNAASVTFSNIVFQHANTTIYGGVIDADYGSSGTTLTVNNSQFLNNSAYGGGAISIGLFDGAGDLNLTGDTFRNNTASYGGAVLIGIGAGNEGVASIINTSFVDNVALINGGAIDSGDNGGNGTLAISSSTFTGNSTQSGDGGAIDSGDYEGNYLASSGSVTLTNSVFTDNSAYNCGGAIDSNDAGANEPGTYSSGFLTVSSTEFSGNTSVTGAGGAINTADGRGASADATITASQFTDNHGGDYGGAIANADDFGIGLLTVSSSTFTGNVSTDNNLAGGAISNGTYGGIGTLVVLNSVFDANGSENDEGGAIATGIQDGTTNPTSATIQTSTFEHNVGNYGGAIANGSGNIAAQSNGSPSVLNVSQSTFSENYGFVTGSSIANGVQNGRGALTTLVRDTFDGGGSTPALTNGPTVSVLGPTYAQTLGVAGSVVGGIAGALCEGSITSGGYNAEQDGGSCNFTLSSDHRLMAPNLAPVSNNGGPTPTELPTLFSPLPGQIPLNTSVTLGGNSRNLCVVPEVDQRGVTLMAGQRCTIGAVDVTPAPQPVTNLVLTSTLTSIEATWNAPTGVVPTVGYRCTLLYGFNNPSNFVQNVSSTNCTFSGLSPNTAWGVSVVALSAGSASAPASAFGETGTVTPSSQPGTGPTWHTVRVTISGFAPNSSALSSRARAEVLALSASVSARGATSLSLVGFTATPDARGSNFVLGRARANAVATALRADLRANSSLALTISTATRGGASPVRSNRTTAGRAANRRVVATFRYLSA